MAPLSWRRARLPHTDHQGELSRLLCNGYDNERRSKKTMSTATTTRTTSRLQIADTSPIASESMGSYIDGLGFSPRSTDLLVHPRCKTAKRSQSSIQTAILEACRTPNIQSWIMVKARLGNISFWHHMDSFISQGMIEMREERSRTLYGISAKGINHLEQLETAGLVLSTDKRTKRSQSSILNAILETCKMPTVKHWIMLKAKVGNDTFRHHITSLISQGMMETVQEGNKTMYRISAKGVNYLEHLETDE